MEKIIFETKKLSEICKVIRGASPRPKGDIRYYNGDIPRLMVEDVTRDGKYVIPSVDSLTEEGAKLSRPMKSGDLTVVCSGTVGIPSFLKVDACIHDGFLGLINFKNNIDKEYIYYQLIKLKKTIDDSATHGGIFTNLTVSGFSDLEIKIPSSDKKKVEIIKILSDFDKLLKVLQVLLHKKQRVKQAMINKLFNENLDTKTWKKITLGDICDFNKGKTFSKSDIQEDGKYKCIHYGELFTHYGSLIERIKSKTDRDKGVYFSKGHEVLMPTSDITPDGLAKASYLREKDVILGGDILIMHPNQDILYGGFLSEQIRFLKSQILKLISGTTVYHIYEKDMRKFNFWAPESINEQKKICSIVNNHQKEISLIIKKITKINLIKQSALDLLIN
jgi:type I restriction enzyme, S subunit